LDRFELVTNLHLNTEFLLQLTREALLEGFARFPLAAREFPETRQMPAGRSLGNEEASLSKHQAGSHLDARGRRTGSLP
jgi:hypothetical protein